MGADPDNEQFKKEYFPAIGHAIVAWALVEIKLDEILFALLSDPKAKPIRDKRKIVTPKQIPKQFELRLALSAELGAVIYSAATSQALDTLLKSARGSYKDRNKLAHGDWTLRFAKKRPPKIFCEVRRQGLPGTARVFSAKQIETLATSFETISEQAYQFLRQNHPAGPLSVRLKKFFDSLRHRHSPSGSPAKPARRHEKPRS
jgi:hypothetical protein